MHSSMEIRIASLLLVATGALGCDLDRLDANRGCDDVRKVDTTGSDSDLPSASDSDSATGAVTDTGVTTEQDTETDFSCHNIACETVADCTCTPNVVCSENEKAPSFIKHHCLIVDCDPNDPSTCPEGVQCLDATELSFGEIGWVCFEM